MRTLNGVVNLVFLGGLLFITAGAVIGTFNQGWPLYEEIAAIGAIITVWGLIGGWIVHTAKQQGLLK